MPINRWIVTELARASEETRAALEAFRFNDAAATLYRFVWNLFCDWYVELSKPTLNGEDAQAADEVRLTMGYTLDRIFALLHPFMPFMTEELYGTTAGEGGRDAARSALVELEGYQVDASRRRLRMRPDTRC